MIVHETSPDTFEVLSTDQTLEVDGVEHTPRGLAAMSDAELANIGLYRPVMTIPEGHRPTSTYARVDGVVQRLTEPKPLDVLKQEKRRAVDSKVREVQAAGFSYDFGGTIGARVLQVATIEDRTNWLTAKGMYKDASQGGQGGVAGAKIRPMDNETITVTFNEAHSMLQAMGQWGADVLDRSWSLKDQITAAASQAELDAIDIETGWP